MEDFVFFIRKKDPRVLIFHEKASCNGICGSPSFVSDLNS